MLGASCSSPDAASAALTWQRLPDLPQALGGQFAGTHNGALIVAGGSYFPVSKWDGGTKKWVDSIYVLPEVTAQWQTFSLPAAMAYGASVSTKDGLLLIGGGDADANSRKVLRVRWDGSKIDISEATPLPIPLANCVAAEVEGTAFVVGGQESPAATAASNALYFLDLSQADSHWKEESTLPGPARILPAVAAVGGKIYVASGADLLADDAGKPARRYLQDAWCFTPGKDWTQLPDLPRVACAAPAMGVRGRFLVFGGSDGILASRENELKDQHPGFSHDVLQYGPSTKSWSSAAMMPESMVTTTAALWKEWVVIPGGEDRPAHRSGIVYGYRFSGATS